MAWKGDSILKTIKKMPLLFALTLSLVWLNACQTPDDIPTISGTIVSVSESRRFQEIDGFGGALPMWVSSSNAMLTEDEIQKLTGMGDQEMGLSLIRTIITPQSENWAFATENLQLAKSYGSDLRILASPWTPPAYMKDNNSLIGGGTLLPEHYQDYVDHLNSYIKYMKNQGVEIDVVSLQNEPDWHPNYESCEWNGLQFKNFLADYGDQIQEAEVLVGESLRFDRAYTDPSLNHLNAVKNFEYVGGHLYSAENSGNLGPYELAEERGKGRWMTEYLIHDADGEGEAIWGGSNQKVWDETLDEMMRTVHLSMEANWNAYLWWWMRRFYSFIGDGESQFGTEKGVILKRGWAFSHYSKFVRPGYTRIGLSTNKDMEMTAYQGDGHIVLVMLNRSYSRYSDMLMMLPGEPESAEAYITSQFQNREDLSINLQGGNATLPEIPPRSVMTAVFTY